MKIILILLLSFSYALSQFNSTTYDLKNEEVLKTFDVNPDFLNNPYFIDVKNSFLGEI